jgi:glycerol-3-phosphate dehydrogenase
LTEAEIKYLIKNEWVKNAEDVVWRRSKLGLRMTPAQISALEAYITGKPAAKKPASKRAKPK